MQRTLIYTSFLLLVISLVVSCRSELDEYKRATKKFEQQYVSENIRVAERALHQHRRRLLALEKRNIQELDVDSLLAFVDGRLSRLYDQLGDNEKATFYFQSATNWLSQSAIKQNRPVTIFSRAELMEVIKYADALMDVGWVDEPQELERKRE